MKFSGLKTIKVLITYSFTLNKNNLYLNIDKIRAGVAFPSPPAFHPLTIYILPPPPMGEREVGGRRKKADSCGKS
jgi:hypothetical protein